jgi:hypothetical protein
VDAVRGTAPSTMTCSAVTTRVAVCPLKCAAGRGAQAQPAATRGRRTIEHLRARPIAAELSANQRVARSRTAAYPLCVLQSVGDGNGSVERCVSCGALAVGPCARRRAPLCGDCCSLIEGGASVWALCFECAGRSSLRQGWLRVLLWLLTPIMALIAAVLLLGWLFR